MSDAGFWVGAPVSSSRPQDLLGLPRQNEKFILGERTHAGGFVVQVQTLGLLPAGVSAAAFFQRCHLFFALFFLSLEVFQKNGVNVVGMSAGGISWHLIWAFSDSSV